jgi:hypothetical protein
MTVWQAAGLAFIAGALLKQFVKAWQRRASRRESADMKRHVQQR